MSTAGVLISGAIAGALLAVVIGATIAGLGGNLFWQGVGIGMGCSLLGWHWRDIYLYFKGETK